MHFIFTYFNFYTLPSSALKGISHVLPLENNLHYLICKLDQFNMQILLLVQMLPKKPVMYAFPLIIFFTSELIIS